MEARYFIGIDYDDENAVVSYFDSTKGEPETRSLVAGSELYQVPSLMAKSGPDGWVIGEEARRLSLSRGEDPVSGLLVRALRGEAVIAGGEEYAAPELLAIFFRRLMQLSCGLGDEWRRPEKLAVCLERLTRENTRLFREMAPRLGVGEEDVLLFDRRECFYYFAYHQEKELTKNDICLFDYRGGEVRCYSLSRNPRTTPQLVTMSEEHFPMEGGNASDGGEYGGSNVFFDRDGAFARVLTECFRARPCSAAYLTGDGFDGGWMKESAKILCRGRRAFVGKNLYSKGACYAAIVRSGMAAWPYVYLGDNEMKVNVLLKVRDQGRETFFTLIGAGDSWYETVGECEVILCGSPEVDFWLQPPQGGDARVERLSLRGLPRREDKATRLRIVARPVSDVRVRIQIRDMGFGEVFRSSEKVWNYEMSLGDEAKEGEEAEWES